METGFPNYFLCLLLFLSLWLLWQSPIGKQAVPHWASMLRPYKIESMLWFQFFLDLYARVRKQNADRGKIQRSIRSIETQMVFQCDPMDFISWYNPSQAYTVKHVSYPRQTAIVTVCYEITRFLESNECPNFRSQRNHTTTWSCAQCFYMRWCRPRCYRASMYCSGAYQVMSPKWNYEPSGHWCIYYYICLTWYTVNSPIKAPGA